MRCARPGPSASSFFTAFRTATRSVAGSCPSSASGEHAHGFELIPHSFRRLRIRPQPSARQDRRPQDIATAIVFLASGGLRATSPGRSRGRHARHRWSPSPRLCGVAAAQPLDAGGEARDRTSTAQNSGTAACRPVPYPAADCRRAKSSPSRPAARGQGGARNMPGQVTATRAPRRGPGAARRPRRPPPRAGKAILTRLPDASLASLSQRERRDALAEGHNRPLAQVTAETPGQQAAAAARLRPGEPAAVPREHFACRDHFVQLQQESPEPRGFPSPSALWRPKARTGRRGSPRRQGGACCACCRSKDGRLAACDRVPDHGRRPLTWRARDG